MVHMIEDEAAFTKLIGDAGDKLVVVDFYADWCGPCKMIAPKIQAMSAEFTDVVFCKVNVDDCGELAEKHGISAMPTFLYLKKGEKIDEVVGANEAQIKEKVQKHK